MAPWTPHLRIKALLGGKEGERKKREDAVPRGVGGCHL